MIIKKGDNCEIIGIYSEDDKKVKHALDNLSKKNNYGNKTESDQDLKLDEDKSIEKN